MRQTLVAAPCALALFAGLAAGQSTVVVPQAAETAGGNISHNTMFNQNPRSWLVVLGAAELNGRLPGGARITGISFRSQSWAAFPNWPGGPATFNNYDIYVAQAALPPGSLDASNIQNNIGPDEVQVRSGPLTIPAGYFQGGAVSPNFNPFCVPIQFQTGYTYTGGDLLIMIRHTGNPSGTAYMDWVASASGAAGGDALSVASYTSNTGWISGGMGGSQAIKLAYAPCYGNCDASTTSPVVNTGDFTCFLQQYSTGAALPGFQQQTHYANCDGSTTFPQINTGDFTCFLQKYAGACP